MQESVLDAYPGDDLSVFIVWIKMYPHDSLRVAKRSAKLFAKEPRVNHFYDPDNLISRLVAEGLGATSGEIAWDCYLFYGRKIVWGKDPPRPTDWVHQLQSNAWADPSRLFRGRELIRKLGEIATNIFDGDL